MIETLLIILIVTLALVSASVFYHGHKIGKAGDDVATEIAHLVDAADDFHRSFAFKYDIKTDPRVGNREP